MGGWLSTGGSITRFNQLSWLEPVFLNVDHPVYTPVGPLLWGCMVYGLSLCFAVTCCFLVGILVQEKPPEKKQRRASLPAVNTFQTASLGLEGQAQMWEIAFLMALFLKRNWICSTELAIQCFFSGRSFGRDLTYIKALWNNQWIIAIQADEARWGS